MKKLIFIVSIFLSVAVLSADFKDLTRKNGNDLDQAYRKKWEIILIDPERQSLYSCNCTSAALDCGPSAVCNIGGCNSTDECLSSGSEACLGLCKSIDVDPR